MLIVHDEAADLVPDPNRHEMNTVDRILKDAGIYAAALLVLGTPAAAVGQSAFAATIEPGSSMALDYGPHAVGFRVINARDSSRAFRPKRDWRGAPAAETARPVQVSLWFPAETGAAGTPMKAGEFRLLREAELSFEEPSPTDAERLRDAFIEQVARFGTPNADAATVWESPTPALRGARAVPGRHPAVLYPGAAGVSNPLLPAYLASHGFVVASFPSNGRMTETALEFTPNALTLDTNLDDTGFVYSLLRRLPDVDPNRVALASFSGSSLTALLWQMRDMQADALVAIEGWERYRRGVEIVRPSVHYDPARVRVPFLMIERAPAEASPAYAKVPDVVDSLRYADVWRVAFRDAAHGDFLSHVTGGRSAAHPLVYELSALMVRLFLQANLNGDADAARALDDLAPPDSAGADFFTSVARPALPAAPTEEELFRLAETDAAAAVSAWRAARQREPERPLFREHVIARAAIFAGRAEDRVALRGLVAEAYPASIDARFALGQAFADADRWAEARTALQEALRLVEADVSLDNGERAAWRERIEARLAELGS